MTDRGETARDVAERLGFAWPDYHPPAARVRQTGTRRKPAPSRTLAEVREAVEEAAKTPTMLALMWMWDPAGVEAILPRRRARRTT